ncbi:hypothetical protein B7H19_29485, partial [Pseudomonas putida]
MPPGSRRRGFSSSAWALTDILVSTVPPTQMRMAVGEQVIHLAGLEKQFLEAFAVTADAPVRSSAARA